MKVEYQLADESQKFVHQSNNFLFNLVFQPKCHFNNFSKSSNGMIESIFFPFGEKLGV